jgi:hypothetical protein
MYTLRESLLRIRTMAENMLPRFDETAEPARRFIDQDGLPNFSHGGNARLIALLGRLYLHPESPWHGDDRTGALLISALEAQRSAVEKTGLIDLTSTNWQSAPDTAFTVQLLAPVSQLADTRVGLYHAPAIAKSIREYVARTVPAIVAGGFHTPNHRWVIASALALAMAIEPATRTSGVEEYIDALLAEGVDINTDGEYSERSSGGYAAVSNRALILMADHLDQPDLLEHVRSSLNFLARMLHPDWSIVTATSTRQDRGKYTVPEVLADQFLIMGERDDNREWLSIADGLFDATGRASASAWLPYPFEIHPELGKRHERGASGAPDRAIACHPADHRTTFPVSGVHRISDGGMSVAAYRENHNLLELSYGSIRLHYARLAGSYFGNARFVATELEPIEDGVVLRMPLESAHHPAYYGPLAERVSAEDAIAVKSRRPRYEVEPFGIEVQITSVKESGRLEIRIVSAGGRDGVPFELALCFAGPLVARMDSGVIDAIPGSSLLLSRGAIELSSGSHRLSVSGGTPAHTVMQMRGALHECSGVQVLLPFMSPLDERVVIECSR